MKEAVIDYKKVKGWGVDADPKNDPTYPMKHRTAGDESGYSWDRPPQQPVEMEVLHSIERPNVTAAFGTAMPPSGLSGMLRRYAFKHSESSYGHWLPLMLADRVNAVEGLVEDLRKGRLPNLPAEYGWGAEWQHDRKRLLTRLAVKGALVAGLVAFLRRRD